MSTNDSALQLAQRFEHDVRQGGFARLLYNLGGASLGDVEDMLIRAKAVVAQEYYVRAIRICLANKPEYPRFLASHCTDENSVKNDLHLLSVQYLTKGPPFAVEASGFLEG